MSLLVVEGPQVGRASLARSCLWTATVLGAMFAGMGLGLLMLELAGSLPWLGAWFPEEVFVVPLFGILGFSLAYPLVQRQVQAGYRVTFGEDRIEFWDPVRDPKARRGFRVSWASLEGYTIESKGWVRLHDGGPLLLRVPCPDDVATSQVTALLDERGVPRRA